jgi:hypothetical protein
MVSKIFIFKTGVMKKIISVITQVNAGICLLVSLIQAAGAEA